MSRRKGEVIYLLEDGSLSKGKDSQWRCFPIDFNKVVVLLHARLLDTRLPLFIALFLNKSRLGYSVYLEKVTKSKRGE